MQTATDFERLTLSGLQHRCAQESNRFFSQQAHDPRYCYEIFRRAILQGEEQAWGVVYRQYQALVAGWVERHSLHEATGEEVQYFVNRAFEKMWTALTPAKFASFPDLKSLLRYLQMCVHSAIIDVVRGQEETVRLEEVSETAVAGGTTESPVEVKALNRVQRQQLWQWLVEQCQDEKEERALYGTFILGLKPRELLAHFEHTFESVNEVYRIKENVLARLRRREELYEFLGDG